MSEMEPTSRSGMGLFIEGLVIVVSILLAFAIDASWDTFRDRQNEERLLESLRAELAGNEARIEDAIARGEVVLAANDKLIEVIGPETAPVPPDSLESLLSMSWSTGPAWLELTAATAVLGSGDSGRARTDALHDVLATLRSRNDKYRGDGDLYNEHRHDLMLYVAAIPGWAGRSNFPRSGVVLQRDRQLQYLVAYLRRRTLILNGGARDLLTLVDPASALAGPR